MAHKRADVYFISKKVFKVSNRIGFSLEYINLVINPVVHWAFSVQYSFRWNN